MIDISVIIVNYNVKELLENCINSVFNSSKGLNIEVIVIDNNSFDGSPEYIKNKFHNDKRLTLIVNNNNEGFSTANNIGTSIAKGEYLLILNRDTILQEDTLIKCLEFYKSKEDIGALTCKLVLSNGNLDLACRRSFPTPAVAMSRIVGLSKLFPGSKTFGKYNLTYLNENDTYEVDAICGAFMMIKKSIYDRVNGFDEDYFMYGEDLDLCFKIKKLGLKNYYYAGTSTIHFKGESTKKSSINYVNNFYGAMRIFVEKNMGKRLGLLNSIIKLSIFYRALFSYLQRIFAYIYPAVIDIILIIIAMLISIKLRFEVIPLEAYTVVIIIYTLVWILTLSLTGTYKKSFRFSIVKPLNGILLGFFVNSSITYFFNEYAYSRVVVLRTAAYAYILLFLWRIIARVFLYVKNKNVFYSDENTIIIGQDRTSEDFVKRLKKNIDTNYNFMGYINTDNYNEHSTNMIGNLNNLKDLVVNYKIKNIIFVKNLLSVTQILDIMWNLKKYNISFKIITGDSEYVLGKTQIDRIDDLYLMEIEYNINKKLNIFVKRIFDITIGFIGIIFIYPVALIINKLKPETVKKDKFINKTLLLPYVLTGKYSLVGRATWDTTSFEKYFLGKHGLTGLVQLNYYKNLTTDEIEYFNSYYAKNQSLSLDLEILLKTLSLYIFRKKVII